MIRGINSNMVNLLRFLQKKKEKKMEKSKNVINEKKEEWKQSLNPKYK